MSEAHYAAPGYLLFGRNNTLFAQRFDVSSSTLKGEAEPIAGDVTADIRNLRTGFSVSQSGELVYSSSGTSDAELIMTDRSGKQLTVLETSGNYSSLNLSPDGRSSRSQKPTGSLTD